MAGRAVTRWTVAMLSAAVVALPGCERRLPPTGQVRLYVDTDALAPPPPGEVLPVGSPPPLFDSLRVDIYEPEAAAPCEGCSRTFAVDRSLLLARDVSIGIPAEPGLVGYVARLRLYHADSTLTGEAPPSTPNGPPTSVIDRWVALPDVGEEGIENVHVVMWTDDVGLPVGSADEPVAPQAGRPVSSVVGTWSGARAVPCAGEAAPGEICVPGGAYWMGHARALGVGSGDAWNRRRLVRLSPFYLDQDEVTVADFRAFGPTGDQVEPWSGDDSGEAFADFCSYTPTPGSRDDRPVVCVTPEAARAYCQAQGKDLPTEAQLEYVAGGLRSRLFVWGSDEPDCPDAVLRRYGYGLFDDLGIGGCLPDQPPGGVETVGGQLADPRRDRLTLPGGDVFDLVGNASEWARDRWNRQGDPCWSAGGVYHDPLCEQDSPTDGPYPVFRLGSWAVGSRQAMAATRGRITSDSSLLGNGVDLGFRCARPGL